MHCRRRELVVRQSRRIRTRKHQDAVTLSPSVSRHVQVVVHDRRNGGRVVVLPLVLRNDRTRKDVHLTAGNDHQAVSRGVQHAMLVVGDRALGHARLNHRLLILSHSRRVRAGDRVRLASCCHYQCVAVYTKPYDGAVSRQHVVGRPGMRQIRLRKPHLVVNESRQEAVRHRDQTTQAFRRRIVIQTIERLAKLSHRPSIVVCAVFPVHAV